MLGKHKRRKRRNEIRTIITLTGKHRIPELEDEIFNNIDLSLFYLRFIMDDLFEPQMHTLPELIFIYALHINNNRLESAEHLLFGSKDYGMIDSYKKWWEL